MPPPSPDNDLKRRARRRLIGAIALLVATIAVLPLLFEDQPPPGSALAIRMQKATPVPVTPVPEAPPAPAQPVAAAEPGNTPVETIPPLLPEPTPLPAENVAAAKPDVAPPRQSVARPAKAEPSVAQAATIEPPAKPVKTGPPTKPAQPPLAKPASAAVAEATFYVQLAALSDAAHAEALKTRAAHTGLPVATDQAGTLTRVRVGPFGSRKAAEDAAATLAANGIPGQVIAR